MHSRLIIPAAVALAAALNTAAAAPPEQPQQPIPDEVKNQDLQTLLARFKARCKQPDFSVLEKAVKRIGGEDITGDQIFLNSIDPDAMGNESGSARQIVHNFVQAGGVACISTNMVSAQSNWSAYQMSGHPRDELERDAVNRQLAAETTPGRPGFRYVQYYNYTFPSTREGDPAGPVPVMEYTLDPAAHGLALHNAGAQGDFNNCASAAAILGMGIGISQREKLNEIPLASYFAVDAKQCLGQDNEGDVWITNPTSTLVIPMINGSTSGFPIDYQHIGDTQKGVKILKVTQVQKLNAH